MRVLITGATGFVGGHLAESLAGRHALSGLSRRGEWPRAWGHLAGAAELHAADLLDTPRVAELVRALDPEWLFHLGGYANTGKSFREPEQCWRDNLGATRSLYDAVHQSGCRPRILFVSSGLIYGDADVPGEAITESATLKPASPYAASKAAADIASYEAGRTLGLDIVRVRLFNQIGPRQSADYAVANFARQVAAIEAGRQVPVLETGDLSAHRDLTDVRDMVAAFPLLMERGRPGEAYNAGSGQTRPIREVLDRMLTHAKVPVEVRQQIQPGRAADTAVTRADPAKLRAATGWLPRYGLDETLGDILDYWRGAGG